MRDATHPTSLDYHPLVEHFLSLPARDRFLRFGQLLSAADICAVVDTILRDPANALLVREPSPDLAGVAHVEFQGEVALLGLSVATWARSLGIGSRLLCEAAHLALQRGVTVLCVRNLSRNPELCRLGRRLGFCVACDTEFFAQRERPRGAIRERPDRRSPPPIALADPDLPWPFESPVGIASREDESPRPGAF